MAVRNDSSDKSLQFTHTTACIRTDKFITVSTHYLQVLLAVKHNALGFDFPIFDVHFVATKDDGNVLTDTDQITMPVGHILIGDSRGDVKHDDSTLSCGGSREDFRHNSM